MQKVDYLIQFGSLNHSSERTTLFCAFLECLNQRDVCNLLDLQFEQEYGLRRAILRKIGNDMISGLQACHYELINNLKHAFNNLPYKKKKSVASSFSFLFDVLPESNQVEVLTLLLQSGYIALRRVGYKKITKHIDTLKPLIESIWLEYADKECAWVIIDHFSVEFLKKNITSLQGIVKGSRYISRLFIKLASEDPACLSELKEFDGISYSYVCVKIGVQLTVEQALSIYERHKFDDRLGLLIWCFGKMKLWDALLAINSQLDQLQYERTLKLLARLG